MTGSRSQAAGNRATVDDLLGKHWHHLPGEEVAELLGSHPDTGLDFFEIRHRLENFGPNRLSVRKGTGPLMRFLLQLHQPLVYILLVSGVISAILREWVDAGVIFGVVLVNAVVGFVQEAKAVNALAALSRTMTTEATVLRQGEKTRIAATEVVPGDIVLLQGGDKVPADLRLLRARELQIDESALTGESLPVGKAAARLALDTGLADRRNMAYASTLVTFGQGMGIVVATGDRTEVGRISELITSAEELLTPLTRKIEHFSNILIYVILGLAAVTVAAGLLRGEPLFDMFMAAVALAVGAIPEGLPAAVTITLAIGVSRMAGRHAIVRKLPAVETLGSTTVICTDKTGTLTENQMTVLGIIAGGARYEVTGTGYDPEEGRIVAESAPAGGDNAALVECLRAGVLCNDSRLLKGADGWQVQGDPTEGALLVSALKAGLAPGPLLRETPRLDAIPFESEHQYMATLHQAGGGRPCTIYLKGAVETIVAKCDSQLDAAGRPAALHPEDVHRNVEALTARGERVLGFARKALPAEIGRLDHGQVTAGFTFLGLQGMIDPPREAAVAAVKTCQAAGVRVKMITGDHPLTAGAIARQVGLAGADDEDVPVLTGRDLARLSDRELIAAAERTSVFARATPEQKLRLVEALQAQGHVVAMTGDGVNDAPALKKADIGVAMGITGTEVAKEAADMVLTDDNFSSIEAAVEEGRSVFDNLTKFIVWSLPTNLGEGLVILVAIFMGVTLPILPVQILWINMTTAGFLGLMLAFEPEEPGIMQRPPRDPKTPILTLTLNVRILLVGALLLLGAFGLFEWELAAGATLAEARTVAVNAFVVMELFYLFNCRSLHKTVFELGFFSNPFAFGGAALMLLLQVAYTYVPLMNRLFQGAPISPLSWLRIAAAGLATYLVVELEKKIWQLAGRRAWEPQTKI
ncbi:MAG: cation-transporting P-type ATPase [Desulfobacteraceae bacterium]|nr:cation-transporting P-type ATPase [Desulfobacteraceae bacterium]